MTEAILSDWDAGFIDDPDVVIPTAVTPPVTPADTSGVTPGRDEPVTPAQDDPGTPLRIGHWEEVTGEPAPARDGGSADLLTRLLVVAKTSPLLGGNSLAAELADPRPDTWSQHWHHVTTHKNLPDGTWEAIGFVAGHLIVTGPLKLTGKAMTVTGNALTWTGQRADRASDHFASAVIFIILAAAITAIIVIAAGQVISYLP